jgi:hypothetical protein
LGFRQTGRARLEASVAEYRAALSTAKQDHANAIAEITALTKQLLVTENRVSAKDAEIQELHRQVGELRQAKVDLERRLATEASHLSADQQVGCFRGYTWSHCSVVFMLPLRDDRKRCVPVMKRLPGWLKHKQSWRRQKRKCAVKLTCAE